MSIAHVFSRNVTYKKHKKRRMFSPHRNHDIHYCFSKLVVQHTKWKKKLFLVITHTKNLWNTKIWIELLKCLLNIYIIVSMFEFVFDQPGELWNICHFGTVFFRFFRYFNKRRKTCRLSSCINRHLSKRVYKINNYTHTYKYLKNKKEHVCFSVFYYFCVWML